MLGFRVAWAVLAAVMAGLATSTAQWPMYQITDCEIGLSLTAEACEQTLWNYFGPTAVPVLAIPAVLCVTAAAVVKVWMSWTVAGAMLAMTVAGFASAFGSATPSLLSTLGSLPGTALAVTLAVGHQIAAAIATHRRLGRPAPQGRW